MAVQPLRGGFLQVQKLAVPHRARSMSVLHIGRASRHRGSVCKRTHEYEYLCPVRKTCGTPLPLEPTHPTLPPRQPGTTFSCTSRVTQDRPTAQIVLPRLRSSSSIDAQCCARWLASRTASKEASLLCSQTALLACPTQQAAARKGLRSADQVLDVPSHGTY